MTTGGTRLDPGALRARLILVLTAITALVVGMFGVATLSAFDRAIAPELENRTRLIGTIVRDEIQNTLDLGIPLEALGGLEAYIDETIRDFDEVARITILQGEANVIAEVRREESPGLLQTTGLGDLAGVGSTQASFPILIGNELVGEIQVEGNPQFVEIRLRDVFLDLSVLALVALLLGVELALAVAAASVWKPYGRVLHVLAEQASGRFIHTIRVAGVSGIRRTAMRLNEQAGDLAQRMRALPETARTTFQERFGAQAPATQLDRLRYSDFNDVRLALFLFATAAEITASFLPVYARDAARPDWLSSELSAAAPLGVYLIAVAVLSPFGGAIVLRLGARRVFMASVVPVALALVGMAVSGSLVSIVLCRGLIGVFYALATIACQEYSMRARRTGEAVQSSSAFVGMIFGGAFCGSVLGGVIGGLFGFPAALVFGAGMALVAGAVARTAMRGWAGEPVRSGVNLSGAGQVSRPEKRGMFAALLFCIAIPMSATTAIFIWYITPLGLASQGYEPGDVARVVMLYYLASTLIGPLARGLATGRAGAALPVVAGAVLTGLMLLAFRSTGDHWTVLAAVSGCGVGHALIRAPMTTLAVNLSGGSGSRMSTFRFGERVGALAGLLASAFILSSYPPEPAIAVLGATSLAGAGAFGMVNLASRSRQGASR